MKRMKFKTRRKRTPPYFSREPNRSTNASAESFNAKVKAFRAQFRGVLDIKFFLFRVAKIFA